MKILEAFAVRFFSQTDERNMFDWLRTIKAVKDIKGEFRSILISVEPSISDDDLHELIALFRRYSIDLKQLATFASPERAWMKDRKMAWFEDIFGTT